MIKAVIFDLDGTLIQTEVLKARSYARAIHQLTDLAVAEDDVLKGFKKLVGLSRAEVVMGLMNQFQQQLAASLKKDNPDFLKHAIISERLAIYHKYIDNPDVLSDFVCPFNLGLLNKLYSDHYRIALATMSHIKEVEKVMKVLQIKEKLALVITRDKISNGKPDPEIYLATMKKLNLAASECLVIEDSVNGIKAARNANLNVFAVTNDFTRESVHAAELLPDEFIIDDLTLLKDTVYKFLSTH